jgi:hypothetical protein
MEICLALILFLFAQSHHSTAETLTPRRQLSSDGPYHFYYHTHYADGEVSPEIVAFNPHKGKGKGSVKISK